MVIKKKVQETLKQISGIHQLVKNILHLTNDIFEKKPKEVVQTYKFIAGDDLDRLLGELLNRMGGDFPIIRLGSGYYMFGTKKIYCKIINGKLVVRVGGGYMAMEEFIRQYGT